MARSNIYRRPEGRESAKIIDLHATAPDTEAGQAFLKTLDAVELHNLAGKFHCDAFNDQSWAMAFLTHPNCDLGTGWLLFLGGGSPMQIEDYLVENAEDESASELFQDAINRNDAIVARMMARDFRSRDFVPEEAGRINEYKAAMKAARAAGKTLRWTIPSDAFKGLKGLEAKSRVEKSGDTVCEGFAIWLAKNNPEQ